MLSCTALLLACPLAAPPDSAPAPRIAIVTTAVSDEPADILEDIVDSYQEAYNEFVSAYRAASDDAGRNAARAELMPDPGIYAEKILALVKEHPGSDVAWEGFNWIVGRAGNSASGPAAMLMMIEQFTDKEELGDVVLRTTRGPFNRDIAKALGNLAESSPHASVQGKASFALGMQYKGLSEAATDKKEKDGLNKRFLRVMKMVCEKHGDVSYGRSTLRSAAEGEVFVAENLQIGMVAPDIAAADLDGVEFKLTDYRGKVVVIDFWGNW